MKRRMLFSIIQILCIVHLSSSVIPTTNVSATTSAEDLIPPHFIQNGLLLATWCDNFTEVTEDIDLSNLGIEKIAEYYSFDKFVALNELNLSSNKLTSTKNVETALQAVAPLILNLSYNNLGSIFHDLPNSFDDRSYKQSKTLLFNSKYFWSIDLSHNSLRGIGIDFEVMYLNLSNNLIQCHSAIEAHRFHGKPIYVGNLDLSHNSIDCQSLFFTPNIRTLDMSYNKLKGLDADGLLRRLRQLTKLNLSHNNIRYIHPRAFEETYQLKQLDLQYNQVRMIYEQVWTTLRSIENVDLSSNRLEYLGLLETMNNYKRYAVNVKNNTKLLKKNYNGLYYD